MLLSPIEIDTHVRYHSAVLVAEAEAAKARHNGRSAASDRLAWLRRGAGLTLIRIGERLAGREPGPAAPLATGQPVPAGPFAS